MRLLWILVVLALAGCAARSSQTAAPAPSGAPDEGAIEALLAEWQSRLCLRIAQAGGDAGAALSELRALRARDALRPARVQFGALDLETEAARWDLQGVLVGRDRRGVFVRYVFVVGVIGRADALSPQVQDLRIVSLASLDRMLAWEAGGADPAALRRYRDSFGAAPMVRFPADDDDFRMQVARDRLSVRETRSGAEWSLALRVDLRDTRGLRLSTVARSSGDAARESCRPR